MSEVRNHSSELLSDNWYILRKHSFELKLRDGSWSSQVREAYDRGNGAAILLYNRERGTVLLTRQFRLPTFVNGNADGMLIEACAGLLDDDNPVECIRRETEEELGYRITEVEPIMQTYMSPGSVTEILHLFLGEYQQGDKVSEGGGVAEESEDIEEIECRFSEALDMIRSGEIRDAKTIILLQHLALDGRMAMSDKR